jgi:hypothetical protein
MNQTSSKSSVATCAMAKQKDKTKRQQELFSKEKLSVLK